MGLKISQLQIPLVIIEITVFFNCIQGKKNRSQAPANKY
jgi:hypothetical protein